MKIVLVLLIFFVPSVAFGYVFNECKPLGFSVKVEGPPEIDIAEDMEKRLATAVETRLRSARLFDYITVPRIEVTLLVVESRVGDRLSGYATAYRFGYLTWAYTTDRMVDSETGEVFGSTSPTPQDVLSWWDMGVVVEPASGQGSYAVESTLEMFDEFILEYLRINEDYCN